MTIGGPQFLVVDITDLNNIKTRPVSVPNQFNAFVAMNIYHQKAGGASQILAQVVDRLTPTASSFGVVYFSQLFCENDAACGSSALCDPRTFTCAAVEPATCPLPLPVPGALCSGGTYIIPSNYTVNDSSVVISIPVVVSGALKFTNTSSVTIQSTSTITVLGCVQLGGDLTVTLASNTASGSGNVTLIEFEEGYCDGQVSKFNTTKVTAQSYPNCDVGTAQVEYGPTSIVVLYTFDTGVCKTTSPGSAESAAVLSPGALAGIIIAAIVLVALIVGAVFLIPKLRNRILPFAGRRNADANNNQQELDD
jgi:hypothetical protein